MRLHCLTHIRLNRFPVGILGPVLIILGLAAGAASAGGLGTSGSVLSCTKRLIGDHPVLDHRRRLSNPPEPLVFRLGDVVQGTFMVRPIFDKNRRVKHDRLGLVFDNSMMDQRHADVFEIEIRPKDFPQYASTFSRRYVGQVRVTEAPRGRFSVSHARDYGGEVLGEVREVSWRNPTADQLLRLPQHSPLSIEGVVVSAHGSEVVVDVGGRDLRITFNRGTPHYYWSTHQTFESLIGQHPEVGHTVRILGYVLHGGIVASSVHGLTFTVEPSPTVAAPGSFLEKIRRAVFGIRQ